MSFCFCIASRWLSLDRWTLTPEISRLTSLESILTSSACEHFQLVLAFDQLIVAPFPLWQLAALGLRKRPRQGKESIDCHIVKWGCCVSSSCLETEWLPHINWTATNEQWSWECKVNPTSLGKVRASESPSLLWSDETSSRLRGKLMYHNCCVVWWICLNIRTDSYQAPNNVRSPREARLITQSLIACNAAPVKNPLRLIRYSPQCARRRLDSSAARRVWQGVVGRDSSCNQLGQCRLADWWNINGKWRRLRLRASLMHCYRSLFPFPSAALATPARCK